MAYTTLLNTSTLSQFTDLVNKEFKYLDNLVKPNAQQLFNVDILSANNGDTKRYDEVDGQTFALLKTEGDDASKASAGVGYTKTMTAKRVAIEIDITWEMRRYNKAPQITSMLTNLATFGLQRLELDLTHIFTFCTSTTYTDMDGVSNTISMGDGYALAYASHALANNADITYRNRIVADPLFTQGGLEAAESLTETDIYSNFGEKRIMNFNKIVSGPDPNTCRTIRQVLQSTADIDAAHAGVLNYYAGKYIHVKLDYLATTATGANDSTKRRWWFLIASGNLMNSWQSYLGIFEPNNLKSPASGNNGEDVHNDNWTYGARMSYGITVLSGKGLIASCPTS